MKTVALLGGGDWTDASVDILDIPEGVDIEVVKKEWRHWYDSVYVPNCMTGRPAYKSVIDMLLEQGAKRSDIEQYEV